jgi:hypothetical protein
LCCACCSCSSCTQKVKQNLFWKWIQIQNSKLTLLSNSSKRWNLKICTSMRTRTTHQNYR